MKKNLLLLAFLVFGYSSGAAVYTVTTTADSGPGSLRMAVINANASGSGNTIQFNIPTSDAGYNASTGVWTITPLSAFPYITQSNITIDGNSQTVAQGNTNPDGPEIMLFGNGNIDFAFSLYNASNITISGFIISKFTIGIDIAGTLTRNVVVKGNYVGVNYNATDTLGNYIGIEILGGPKHVLIGGNNLTDRNIVSGNNHIGIRIGNADSNVIAGNYVGVDRTGTYALRNYDGISVEATSRYNIIGSYVSGGRNLVSGNVAYGIPVFGGQCNNNTIIGNYIGTDVSGSFSIPNTYGVLFDDGACFNLLGGRKAGAGNLLSGNSGYGVFIYNNSTNSDTVTGNLIGTKANGTEALPNVNGIVIDAIPSYHTIDSNVISGNLQQGIVIHATGTNYNVITRNRIGTDISGNMAVPNQIDGIRIGEGPQHNLIGGSQTNGNIIANNGGNGVTIMTEGDYYNIVSGNSIYNNGSLGIDLYPAGINPNDAGDADTGPNFGMNYPVITQAFYNSVSGNFLIAGTIDTPSQNTVNIDLYKSDNCAAGYGQGEKYLTSITPDAAGNFNVVVVNGIWGGDKVTATATDALGNTSEFSANLTVTGIDNNEENLPFSLCPVPAKDQLTLTFSGLNENAQLIITDLRGQTILTKTLSPQTGTSDVSIDVSRFAAGVYVLQITSEKYRGTRKFIKE
jgi:parallel beta-helix repeat protein